MNPMLIKLPLDLTSEATTNRITDEYHDTSKYSNVPYRIIVLNEGYFYSHTVAIRDSNGYDLVPNADFQVTGLHPEATGLSGYEVCSVIVITNPRLPHYFYINAQMVGGVYTTVANSISNLAETLLNDTRSIDWIRVDDKPNSYPTNGHLHALWHFYGFDEMRSYIDGITNTILAKSTAEVQVMLSELQARYTLLSNQRIDDIETLDEHINNNNNPHNVTRAQVGLSQVQNYPVATFSESNVIGSGVRSDRYVTPYSVANSIRVNLGNNLNTHIGNYNNPHGVTANQIGAYNSSEFIAIANTLLGVNETAVGSERWLGNTYNDLMEEVQEQFIPVANVTSSTFNPETLGTYDGLPEDFDPYNLLLQGDRRWVLASDVLASLGYGDVGGNTYGKRVIFSALAMSSNSNLTTAFNYVTTTYGDIEVYPEGTLVLMRINTSFSISGNASNMSSGGSNIVPFYRTAGGWMYPTGTVFSYTFYQNDGDAGNQTTSNP